MQTKCWIVNVTEKKQTPSSVTHDGIIQTKFIFNHNHIQRSKANFPGSFYSLTKFQADIRRVFFVLFCCNAHHGHHIKSISILCYFNGMSFVTNENHPK